MGTSQSSNGAPSGVPLVPPWADNPNSDNNGSDETQPNGGNDNPPNGGPNELASQPPLAPPARFRGARLNLNNFARSGDKGSLQRGVGHFIKTGYGGSKTATKRLGQTIKTAGALYNTLSFGSSKTASELDTSSLQGKSSDEITDAIIEAVRPIDGDLDSEASRDSMKNAFSELLDKDENSDLLNLTEDQKIFVIEKFVAGDVFKRFDLDLGKSIRKNSPTLANAMSRLKEAKDYIKETVASSFKKTVKKSSLSARTIISIVKDALEDALHVFESYAV
jgi:hypothetical protein